MKQGTQFALPVEIGMDLDDVSRIEFVFKQKIIILLFYQLFKRVGGASYLSANIPSAFRKYVNQSISKFVYSLYLS